MRAGEKTVASLAKKRVGERAEEKKARQGEKVQSEIQLKVLESCRELREASVHVGEQGSRRRGRGEKVSRKEK